MTTAARKPTSLRLNQYLGERGEARQGTLVRGEEPELVSVLTKSFTLTRTPPDEVKGSDEVVRHCTVHKTEHNIAAC